MPAKSRDGSVGSEPARPSETSPTAVISTSGSGFGRTAGLATGCRRRRVGRDLATAERQRRDGDRAEREHDERHDGAHAHGGRDAGGAIERVGAGGHPAGLRRRRARPSLLLRPGAGAAARPAPRRAGPRASRAAGDTARRSRSWPASYHRTSVPVGAAADQRVERRARDDRRPAVRSGGAGAPAAPGGCSGADRPRRAGA